MTRKSFSTEASYHFLIGRKAFLWAFWILLFVLPKAESVSAQAKDNEKPFSLSHFNAEQIRVDDRSPTLPKELVAIAGTYRGRSSGWILCIAFSPDGKRIAGAGDGNRISIWDSVTLREVATIQLEGDRVESLAFAPDGKSIAFQNQGLIWLYDLTGQEPKVLTKLESNNLGESGCVFSPDSMTLATSGRDGIIRLWDLSLPKPTVKATLENRKNEPNDLLSLTFARDGKVLVSEDAKGKIISWDLTTKPPRELTGIEVETPGGIVGWLKKGNTLVSANDGGDTIRFWRLTNKELKEIPKLQVKTGGKERYIRCFALASDEKTLAVSVWSEEKEAVEIWDFDGHQTTLRKVHEVSYSPYPMVFSPDGKVLAAGLGATIQLFDPTAETLLPKVMNEGHTARLRAVAFSPNGKTLATASDDKTIRFWDLTGSRPREVNVLQGHSGWVTSIAFSPDGKYLASTDDGSNHTTLHLWGLEGVKARETAVLRVPIERSHSITFSPDGKFMLAACSDTETQSGIPLSVPAVWVWDLKTTPPKSFARLKGSGAEGSVAISPDGKTVTSGNTIWDLGSLEKRALDVLFHQTELAFSADGKTLAGSVGYKTVGLVDMTKPKPDVIRNLRGPAGPTAVTFSLDGKKLAAAGEDGKVFVWKTATTRRLHEWHLPGPVYGIAFAPDNRHLATANANGTAYILRLKE